MRHSKNLRSNLRLYDGQVETPLEDLFNILERAAETKDVDGDICVSSLLDLEKTMRKMNKNDPNVMVKTLENLYGDWQLVFTTGTIDTQKKIGKINYFPIKAVQSFTEDKYIQNTIWAFGAPLIKFSGEYQWLASEKAGITKLTFDFDKLCLLEALGGGFTINLKKGEAASLGAKSGLGSESNVDNAKKDKAAFFNWISANRNIATARGGGGGLALWKRI